MLTGECQIFKSSAYLEDPHGCGSILGEPEQHNMEKGGHWLEYPNTEMVQLTLTGISKSMERGLASPHLNLFHGVSATFDQHRYQVTPSTKTSTDGKKSPSVLASPDLDLRPYDSQPTILTIRGKKIQELHWLVPLRNGCTYEAIRNCIVNEWEVADGLKIMQLSNTQILFRSANEEQAVKTLPGGRRWLANNFCWKGG
ncbi:hypothetical protein H5410_001893 [Solanum commersonii]|uniref:Uncharacterized protein n=1 Tax=Solanum commersonii TaxID=4109 RepID=A0A9J6B0D3_SOLCO|nr:hypothetical protein H5410_001893 [Solanum commersonii]